MAEISIDSALERLQKRCSLRELCQQDVINKLKDWGFSYEDSLELIVLLISNNFINEERYAKAYANDKVNLSSWGKQKIIQKLKAKNISSFNIKTAIDQIDQELYYIRLEALIAHKKPLLKGRAPYDIKQKLLRFLNSRGFVYSEYQALI